MTTSVARSCITKQNCKTNTKTTACTIKTDFFWSQTGLVLRPTRRSQTISLLSSVTYGQCHTRPAVTTIPAADHQIILPSNTGTYICV